MDNYRQGEPRMNDNLRLATPADHDCIYALKAQSIRPYVEPIWGWDETYQRTDFDRDFSAIQQFQVVEVDGRFAGFVQCCFSPSSCEVVELHLLEAYRGHGIGSHILQHLQETCMAQNLELRIGCFKENRRAKQLYEKLGFIQIEETDSHYLFKMPLPSSDTPIQLQR